MRADQLQDMSMPELWNMAVSLGIPKRGRRTELVERILEAEEEQDMLEGLKQGIARYEKAREELKALLEAASRFAPRFHEKKEGLERSILEDQEKIGKIDDLTAKLEEQRDLLQEDLKRRQEQISEIDRQIEFVSQAKNQML